MIEGYRLEARYDYMLDSLAVRGITNDDGQAAARHLAAGRPIYYGDDAYLESIIREYPDGRKQLVSVDDQGVISVIRELP